MLPGIKSIGLFTKEGRILYESVKAKKQSVSIVNVFQYGIMFLPMLTLFLIFSTYPVIEGVFFSFTDWDGLNSKFNFIGFTELQNFFHDFVVLKPLYISSLYMLLGDNYSEYMCAGPGISL